MRHSLEYSLEEELCASCFLRKVELVTYARRGRWGFEFSFGNGKGSYWSISFEVAPLADESPKSIEERLLARAKCELDAHHATVKPS